MSRKKESTKIIKTNFSEGLTRTSRLHPSLLSEKELSKSYITNSTDLGMIGDHCFIVLVPLIDSDTVYYSTKLFDLPIPI